MDGIEKDPSKIDTSKFKLQPLKHQLECLLKHGRSAYFALLSEQGTGKTKIIIDNVADLWSSEDCDGMLVIAPNGVHYNWTIIELPKHMPDWVRWRSAAWGASMNKKDKKDFEALYDDVNSGELRILAMNWEALQTDRGFKEAKRFAGCFSKLMIVCDESDACKNPQAIRTKNLMKLKPYSQWRRIMTGTPIDGSPFSAFSQFSFLDESILQTTSYFAFKAEYAELLPQENGLIKHIVQNKTRMKPETKARIWELVKITNQIVLANGRQELIDISNKMIEICEIGEFDELIEQNEAMRSCFSPKPNKKKTECLKAMAAVDEMLAQQRRAVAAASNPKRLPQIVEKDKEGKKKYKNLDKLSALIAPHSFRVLKKDCLDLPDKIYKSVFFDMTKEQEEVYKKAEKECRLVFEGQETPFTRLVAVTKLAQITSGYYIHPFSNEPVRIPGENPKLNLLKERVQAIVDCGKKVIVWARYRIEIEDIVRVLTTEGIKCVEYHGGVKKYDRIDAIDEFENGDASVFVANQQAGGTGLTLIAASYMIYFSNDFSLRNRLQSEDRAHRIGQTENVTYINIAARNTVDEKVVKCVEYKKEIAETIIDLGLKLFS